VRIYTRAEWGAEHDAGAGPAPIPARELWLHHSVTAAPPHDIAAEKRAMRQLEQIGENRFRRGISYTFAVMPSGRVYEGTGPARLGTHTGGRNTISRGIVLVGNYQLTVPPEVMLRGAADLLRHGYGVRWWLRMALNGGHRDVKATGCPGDRAYALIARINAMAAAGATPTPASPPPIEEEDVIVPVHVPPGEHRVFHVEPTTNGGRDSAIGAKRAILVLNAVGNSRVPAWVYFQSLGEASPKKRDLWGGQGPFVTAIENRPGGWLDIANNGSDDIGGSLIYVR
jgi:hypothetical protein